MGVCGSGKTTIGSALARALDVPFVDGDDFHPPENVRKMAAGIPLTDDDRAGWLRALADRMRDATRAREGLVVACSALKRAYRDVLRQGAPDARFVYLDGPRELLATRMSARRGHYMPASLLDSQLATLERPSADERAIVCDVSSAPADVVAAIIRASA